jgi:transcription elongation factor GreA
MQRIPMTPRGKRLLEERLHHIKAVERPQNIEDIETARAHGDLSENAEYKYAKNRQSELEAQIRYCESRLALAQVIDPAKLSNERVVFGATVELADLDTDEEYTYKIVGEDEADIDKKLLSITSPLAKGLIGKEEGDEASIRTPKGVRKMEILSIEMTADLPA